MHSVDIFEAQNLIPILYLPQILSESVAIAFANGVNQIFYSIIAPLKRIHPIFYVHEAGANSGCLNMSIEWTH